MVALAIMQFLVMGVVFVSSKEGGSTVKADPKEHGNWQNVRTSEGVNTYFRWMTDKEGTKFRARKGEMDIQCSLNDAIKILTETQYTYQWMAGVEESKTLDRPAKNEWYTYTVFSVPWPLNKRDLVSLNRISTDPEKGIATIDVFCKDNYLPAKEDIIRLRNYKAQWKITEINKSKLHLSFTAESSSPPAFPRYIQDPVIEKIFHNNLVRLKNLLESQH